MNQSNELVQIALLYSIKTDDAQEFQLDKIDFMNTITKQFYSTIQNEILQVKGLFGTYQEVQREIQLQINKIVNLQSYLNHSEKGSLIAIKYQNFMIFCLILSETFFVTKPINEKAIEIVLFRILQDLTDNIKLCFNDSLLKNNWYQGDIIPFNSIQQRTEYYFAESENKETQLYDCKWILSSKNITNYQIINSQTLSPQLTRIRQLQFSQQEIENFDKNYENFILSLFVQILNTNQKQTNQLIKIFKIEHQSKNLKNILDKLSDELEKEAKSYINKLIEKLVNEWKSSHKGKTIEDIRKKFEQQVNNVLQTVELSDKRVFIYNHELIDKNTQKPFEQQIDVFFKKMEEKIRGIKKKYDQEKTQITNELKKQTSYEVERISLKLSRVDENESGRVQNISQIDNQEYTILNSNYLELQSSKFIVKDIFETKEKAHIYIIISQDDRGQCKSHIYLQKYKALQIQKIKQLDFKDTDQAVYFHDYNRGHLYIFNFRKNQVLQIIITAIGTIQNEQQVYYQQEDSSRFLVSHVAYLKVGNKFIVLSKENVVYKQQDQGQDFEQVKCIQQFENRPKKTDFKPSIKPENKYNQLLSCPSGNYFYLANNYCCDRYDLNCMRIQSIQIEGPIKIFANNQDVIILCQLNQSESFQKKAKIISNLVSQKKFNKQENNEKKVIGNPVLDIAKGSFIKFGPNSQFLLQEKQIHISLYVNKEYYDIMKPYFNIMKVNEIIMDSSMLKFVECKSEQIKNIIFSRVPLQLCTIENSNLIPLNDGFRQHTQIQTIISVDQKVKQLHLGFLEDHLSNYNNKIFVVGIIGKQSSGKSYLLNRVFGTRFSVSSARCTDGVWGSIAYIENQTFLVLDCEGLFNGARTDKEEIKMLAFLTALCDITILNSDLTFNRHFNDLFNHLVEASKQLNDDKLFKGILYFVLRDVSSNDNSGAEKELLKNLERLKEGGSEEIVFLKRLFNNKIAVEPLVNYELNKFDEQISSVRNYILNKSKQTNHWNSGRELIQIMKILLCQLELSDNTNVSLIDLQILIEKIFEESKELWYDFSSTEVSDNNLQLVQSDYKFPKHEEHQHLLFNQELVKQLYKNLITEDTISTHNKNLLQIKTQFHQMMEQRKELIIQRAQSETNNINNVEVKEMIQKNMQMLKIFLSDQIKQYQFCEDKCNECHLQCKQFKNHIEISQILMQKLNEAINKLETQQQTSKIKNKSQEQEKRERIDIIKEEIKEAEYTLESLTIYNKIIEIQEKLFMEKDAMSKYDFYDSSGECINISVFQMTQFQNQKSLPATLDDIEYLQNLFDKQIPSLQNLKEKNNESIEEQRIQIEQLKQDLNEYQEEIKTIEIKQDKLQCSVKEISEQKLKILQDLQIVESEIKNIQIDGNEMDLSKLQINFDNENKKLIEIQDELQNKRLNIKNEQSKIFLKYLITPFLFIYSLSAPNQFQEKKEQKMTQCQVSINTLKEQIQQLNNNIDNINQRIQEVIKMNRLKDISENVKSKIKQFEKSIEDLDQQLQIQREKLGNSKQNQESTMNKRDQIIKDNIKLDNKNLQIDEEINNLKRRLDQIEIFQQNLNEYTVLKATLQEEQNKLKKINELEFFNNLKLSEVQSKLQQLQNLIYNLKEEKDQLSNQLKTYNSFVLNEQNLRDLQDYKQKVIELKFDVHSCYWESHKCDQNCKICPDKICDNKAGHNEKQEHLCNKQDHRCQNLCQIIDCQSTCMKCFKHDSQHKCENDHPCKEKCQFCEKKCKKDRCDPHQNNHDCQDNSCTNNCKLCHRKCCHPHKHSLEKDNHFCENVHQCQVQCQEEGICKLEYEVIEATWKTQLSEFQYTKYIPKDIGKQICQKMILKQYHKHDGIHLCKEKTEKQFHLCNQSCPECNTYCDLQYGHQGLHSSERHRNKENQIFTIQKGNQDKIKIQDQKETTIRQYQIGESSAPETCDRSCKRRGRAHFHLVKCQGGLQCLEKKNLYKARHSKEKYVGFENMNFDEVLCSDFWKLQNWVHPIYNELDNINKCNYQCPLCKQFCENDAWHTQDDKINAHSFSCVETHMQNSIKGLNVTFIIDSTLSMEKYIKMCKLTIKDIMEKSKAQKNFNGKQLEVNFAAVSYKDHKTPYDKSQKIIDIQDFTSDNVIISFLDKIVLENGIDYPEAVLDGLDASLKLKWNPNYEKLVFLIADSPPHGKQYSDCQDNFPKGCPCGLQQDSIFKQLKNIKVQFKILKLNQNLEAMITEFKKVYEDLQVLTPNKQDEVTFKNLIVSDVCKILQHNEITYQMKK